MLLLRASFLFIYKPDIDCKYLFDKKLIYLAFYVTKIVNYIKKRGRN